MSLHASSSVDWPGVFAKCSSLIARYDLTVSQPMPPPPGFDDLTTDDKVDYLTAPWERIATTAPPQSREWHRDLVRAEIADDAARPDEVEDWTSVRTDIEQQLRNRKR